MEGIELYLALLGIVAAVGILFRDSTIPTSLLLVMTGMVLSFVPSIPSVKINPNFVLDIFLPLLLYNASAYSSTWQEMKRDIRPIIFLSIGHVLFITVLVAAAMHYLIPEMGWPLAFVLGAVISPPDDVAILSIAEKIKMPSRIVTVLKGEAMLNDATALIIFRFALIAVVSHQFSTTDAILSFFSIILGETLYGMALGYIVGELRLRLREPNLQMMISLLTPFVAYLPAEKLGGSGVISTVVTGLFIGHFYWERYTADVRLTARSLWLTLEFIVQSILFLLVGLDFRYTLSRISTIPASQLILYGIAVVLVVIIGRFIWVYPSAYLPRYFSEKLRKARPYPPWQYPFIVSWAGMRGGISLAAAIIVPSLPIINGFDPRDLLIYLVFCVIVATLLIQGLTLPWLLKIIGVDAYAQKEKFKEMHQEFIVRIAMVETALYWLQGYKTKTTNNKQLVQEIDLHIQQYKARLEQLQYQMHNHDGNIVSDDSSLQNDIFLAANIIELERQELLQFWRRGGIEQATKNKLEQQLDLRAKHLENVAL